MNKKYYKIFLWIIVVIVGVGTITIGYVTISLLGIKNKIVKRFKTTE